MTAFPDEGEPIQPLEGRLNLLLSLKLPHKFLCFALSQFSPVTTNSVRLTKSSLFDLLRRKSKCREELYHYLQQNVCQGWRRRNPSIDTESTQEVLEGRKQVDQCVIASTDVFDRLWDLDVTEMCQWDRKRKGNIQQVIWQCRWIWHSQAEMADG